jgi:drug/metabolite transporter (DMT)-like permease
MSAPAAVASRSSLLPLVVGWSAVLLWGGSPIATRIAVSGIDPVTTGVLRTLLALPLVLPLAIALRLPLPSSWRDWTLMLGAALGSYVLFPILFSIGVRHTTASHAALVHASTPLFTGVIAALLERRWPARWWWLGVAVALIGEALLIGLSRGFQEPGVTIYGDLVVFAACVAVAFGYVAGGSLSKSLGSLAVTFWGVVIAAALTSPAVVVIPLHELTTAEPAALGGLAYLVVISSVIGYVAWNWALANGGIGRMGVLQFAQPVMTICLAVLLLRETLTLSVILSTMVILSGVALARRDLVFLILAKIGFYCSKKRDQSHLHMLSD